MIAQDASLGDGQSGSMAIGGNLTLAGPYEISAPADTLALVVGSRVDFAGSAATAIMRVTSGNTRISELTGVIVKDDRLVPVDNYQATPRIELSAKDAALQGKPVDFATMFTAMREKSADLARCEHVLNLTGAQFNALRQLTFPVPPTSVTPLLINVDTTATDGIFRWHSPDFLGITSEQARHVLINFPDATDLHHAAGGVVRGTIFAPHARFVDFNPSPIEGALVVKSLEGGVGELRPYPYAASFGCGSVGIVPAGATSQNLLAGLAVRPMVWFGMAGFLLGLMILIALVGHVRRGSHSQSDVGRIVRR